MASELNRSSPSDCLKKEAASCCLESPFSAWCRRFGWGSAEGRILVFCLILNLLLFITLFLWITPGYETNDDPCMQMIASGFFDNQPSEHLVFTSFLIGWPLRLLYTFSKGSNWYLLYLVGTQFAAMTALCFLVLRRSRRWSSLWIYLGFFCLIQVRMVVNLQFTTTAFLAGATGIFLLAEGLSAANIRWTISLCGVLFLGLATMIRETVVALVVAVAVPFLFSLIKSVGWRRMLGAGGAAAAAVLILIGSNGWYYQRDPGWSKFVAYNRVRGQIHGTPLTNAIPQVVARVGWSKNDGALFKNFYFAEPEVYGSPTKVQLLLNELKSRQSPRSLSLGKEVLKCWFLPDVFPRDSGWFMKLALLNSVGCVLLLRTRRAAHGLTLLATYGVIVGLSGYLRSTARLPERVAFAMPMFLTCLCLYWFSKGSSPVPTADAATVLTRLLPTLSRPRFIRVMRGAMLFGCAALYVPALFHFSEGWWYENAFNRQARMAAATIFDPVASLVQAGQKAVLVPMPQESGLECCLPYIPTGKKSPFCVVPYGWPTHSPIFQRVLEQNHLQPYSLSLLDRPDVLFCMDDNWQVPLQTFYREHYGRIVSFDLALSVDGIPDYPGHAYRLYRAHTISASTPRDTASKPDGNELAEFVKFENRPDDSTPDVSPPLQQ